jgi:hypothetical protein
MVLKIVTSLLLLILTSVSSAIAPVAFADPSPAQVRRVSSVDDCWYAYCKTPHRCGEKFCDWSGPHHTGSSGEAEASADATDHMKNMEKTDKENPYHVTQPKSCSN